MGSVSRQGAKVSRQAAKIAKAQYKFKSQNSKIKNPKAESLLYERYHSYGAIALAALKH